jgi:hypothetical protein
LPWVEGEGFAIERVVHPALCHSGLLGWKTNKLQFAALWKRELS